MIMASTEARTPAATLEPEPSPHGGISNEELWAHLLVAHGRLYGNTFRRARVGIAASASPLGDNVTALLSERYRWFWERLSAVIGIDCRSIARCMIQADSSVSGIDGAVTKAGMDPSSLTALSIVDSVPVEDVGEGRRHGEGNLINSNPEAQNSNPQVTFDDLFKHEQIADRIMRHCFPGNYVIIFEYSECSGRGRRQRRYEVLDRNTPNERRERHLTTYFGSRGIKKLNAARISSARLPTKLPFNTNLLSVNSSYRELGNKYLYGRKFFFQCSAEGVQMFLTTHRAYVSLIQHVVLYYHFDNEPNVVETRDRAWRSLMRCIRHEFSCIPAICLRIGSHFWEKARWELGASTVIEQESLCNDRSGEENFLHHLAKIAAPADRWRGCPHGSPHRKNGTTFRLFINSTTKDEQKKFLSDLRREIEKRRELRPLFVKKADGTQITYQTKYSEYY